MAGKSTVDVAGASTQDVARIREIILGPHLRESEQRFQVIQRDLDRLQSLIVQLTDQVHEQDAAQAEALQSEAERMNGQLADQDSRQEQRLIEESSKLQAGMAALRTQVEQQDRSQGQRLKQEVDRLDKQLALADSNTGKKLQALQRETRQADDELRNELRQMVDKLTHDKTDRRSLGQMLVEIGNQLTRSNEAVGLDDLLSSLSIEPQTEEPPADPQ